MQDIQPLNVQTFGSTGNFVFSNSTYWTLFEFLWINWSGLKEYLFWYKDQNIANSRNDPPWTQQWVSERPLVCIWQLCNLQPVEWGESCFRLSYGSNVKLIDSMCRMFTGEAAPGDPGTESEGAEPALSLRKHTDVECLSPWKHTLCQTDFFTSLCNNASIF